MVGLTSWGVWQGPVACGYVQAEHRVGWGAGPGSLHLLRWSDYGGTFCQAWWARPDGRPLTVLGSDVLNFTEAWEEAARALGSVLWGSAAPVAPEASPLLVEDDDFPVGAPLWLPSEVSHVA